MSEDLLTHFLTREYQLMYLVALLIESSSLRSTTVALK